MEGILLITGLIFGTTAVGLRSRSRSTAPGIGMIFTITVAGAWYLFG